MLERQKAERRAGKIGISVYTGQEIDHVLSHFDIDIVQLPLNVLDRRLLQSGHLSLLKSRGIEVHIRSAFLQGLLLMPPVSLPHALSALMPVLECWRDFLRSNGLSPLEGAFAFLCGLDGIDVVVTGVTRECELLENIRAFGKAIPPGMDFPEFAVSDEQLIDPRRWPPLN